MLVRSVTAKPFITYPDMRRSFPAQGIVLLTGLNGTGKSSVYEMVSWCLYGETLRGAKVVDAQVSVCLDERGETYVVERARGKRGSATLTLKCGPIDMTGATPTETQVVIDREFGSFEQFCSGRVFARDLLAKMALATDKERKNLLEELLGLQQFDKAYKQALANAAAADAGLRVADAQIPHLNTAHLRAVETEKELAAKEWRPLEVVEKELADLEAKGKTLDEKYKGLSMKLTDLLSAEQAAGRQLLLDQTKSKEAEHRVQALEAKLEQLQHETHCNQCGRELDALAREESIIATEQLWEVAREEADDTRALKAASLRVAMLREEAAEIRPDVDAMGRTLMTSVNALAETRAEHRVTTTIGEARTRAGKATQDAARALAEAQGARKAAEGAKGTADAVSEALGLRGARCLLLGRALRRLEQEANLFLAQVHPTLRVKVEGEEKVTIEVVGAGGGDYRGCSGGQRVLIDIALMLGMATLRGGDGLLVFDEVFDSLDGPRVEVVADYLQTIARTRQILVISHREDFAALFRKAACWRAVMDADGFSQLEEA